MRRNFRKPGFFRIKFGPSSIERSSKSLNRDPLFRKLERTTSFRVSWWNMAENCQSCSLHYTSSRIGLTRKSCISQRLLTLCVFNRSQPCSCWNKVTKRIFLTAVITKLLIWTAEVKPYRLFCLKDWMWCLFFYQVPKNICPLNQYYLVCLIAKTSVTEGQANYISIFNWFSNEIVLGSNKKCSQFEID